MNSFGIFDKSSKSVRGRRSSVSGRNNNIDDGQHAQGTGTIVGERENQAAVVVSVAENLAREICIAKIDTRFVSTITKRLSAGSYCIFALCLYVEIYSRDLHYCG
jgi:hypothetical protein